MPTLAIEGWPGRLHYKSHTSSRPGSGPPLVLVHGAGGNLMHWPGEMRRLDDWPVFALDLPGHGHSEGADSLLTDAGSTAGNEIGAYAQVVAGFARKLSLPRFVLAGHSMGGAVALELVLRQADMLAGLVLVATGARLPVAPELLSAIQNDYEGASRIMATWSQGAHPDPGAMRIYLQRLRELDPRVLYRDYSACAAWDRTTDLGAIKVPTLVICGDSDRMTPLQYSLDLQRSIKNAQLVVVSGAGHMVMLEQPALVARSVRQFLTELASGS